jgi:DNA-binding NarL/FixJ family response regulator
VIRVLVADDQEAVRTGLRMLLALQPGIEVVGEAADGVAAVRLARRLRPDVALLDIRMPLLDGIEATALLAGARVPDPIAVVVITTFDLDEYVHGALRAGAKGFLLKDAGSHLIGEAVRAAANGDALISPQVTVRLLDEFSRPVRRVREPSAPLTRREEDVLALLATGLTNTEIGERLFLSLGTVKTHIAGVLAKLGLRNRVEAAMWAYESGRVHGDPPADPRRGRD